MANPIYQVPAEFAPTHRLCQAAVFIVALLLVVGLTQFIAPPFADEPGYDITLQEGFVR